MKFLVLSVIFPQIASITGWYAAEFGRQPWTVYKLLRTNVAYSGGVTFNLALLSLSLIVLLYTAFFVLFLVLLDRKIKHGPVDTFEEAPYRDPYKQH
jgi:cytochrome d ubiquinol oxidase subunit I